MARINIDTFENNPNSVKDFESVTIFIDFNQEDKDEDIKNKMADLGFDFVSNRFVGPDLMDSELYFKKHYKY